MSCETAETDYPQLAIEIAQGATWRESYTYQADDTPIDITDVVIEMEIKWRAGDAAVLRLTTGAVVSASDGGGITITDGSGGEFEVLITDERTDLLTQKRGLYQIRFAWQDGTEDLFLHGPISVVPNI